MVGIQEIRAQIGRATGEGIAGNLRRHGSPFRLLAIVTLLLIANLFNLGAGIGAMGAAMALLVPGSALIFSNVLTVCSLLLLTFTRYDRYIRCLRWLALSLLAYLCTALVVHVPWKEALRATVLPSFAGGAAFWTSVVAVFGTTLSPYLFFWQCQQEVERGRETQSGLPLRYNPASAEAELGRIRTDTRIGMGFSNLVAFFIILTAAATLNVRGVTDIETAAQAAEALRPLAGEGAFLLFTLGVVGTGLLAIPALAGSAAYALGEALGLPVGLNYAPRQAKGFYLILALGALLGLGMNVLEVNPIKALFWSAVLNGIVAGPIMVLLMQMVSDATIMGRFTISRQQRILGWAATVVMLATAMALLGTSFA